MTSNLASLAFPIGSHPSALCALIDLGTHEPYGDGEKHRIFLIGWELLDCFYPNENPIVVVSPFCYRKISTRMPLDYDCIESLNDGYLTDYDYLTETEFLGKSCMIDVSYNTKESTPNAAYCSTIISSIHTLDNVISSGIRKPMIENFFWTFRLGPFVSPSWLPDFHPGVSVSELISRSEQANKEIPRREPRTSYSDYLKSDHWQEKRRLHLAFAGYRCQVCNGMGELHVHHRTYSHLNDERFEDLIVLCQSCHELFHRHSKLAKGGMS